MFVENDPEIDLDSIQTQEEVDAAVKELFDYLDQEHILMLDLESFVSFSPSSKQKNSPNKFIW